MVKFNELIKLKLITTFIIFSKYSLWYSFFIFQGKAINLAIEKNTLLNQVIFALIGYVLVKIAVMLCDIFQKFIIEYYKNISLKQQWAEHIPRKVYRDNQNNQSNINVLFFDYLPRLFDCETSIATNNATIFYVFTLTIITFLYTRFFYGLIALTLVFTLNYISKHIFTKKIDVYCAETNTSKIKILHWVDQYFSSYKEISKNWQGINQASWANDIYKNYFSSKNNQLFFFLYRDLLCQLLVELPFLLSTSIVILGVYYDHLSLTQLFIWAGFSQFMINASNAYLENRVTKQQLTTLTSQTCEILRDFKSNTTENIKNNFNPLNSLSEVTLKDGSKNSLSLTPGVYHIKGGNGSGKSTLINIILGYERTHYDFENINLLQLIDSINQDNIRIIERDSIVFDCFDDINTQICGPLNIQNDRWVTKINQSLAQLLEPALVKKWMDIFLSLESEYIRRENKTMSSGEKIILSLMRFLASWNKDVCLLIVDECDSFLDHNKKQLFIEMLNILSSSMAIYIVSHDASFKKSGYHDKTTPSPNIPIEPIS